MPVFVSKFPYPLKTFLDVSKETIAKDIHMDIPLSFIIAEHLATQTYPNYFFGGHSHAFGKIDQV